MWSYKVGFGHGPIVQADLVTSMGVASVRRMVDRTVRFRALDPALNAARAAGLMRWGPNLNALVHASALRWPRRTAIIDDNGIISYRDLDRQSDKLANHLRQRGDGTVGIMCRNHRGFVIAQLGLERCGRDYVLLNTALSTADLRNIVRREHLQFVIADDFCAQRLGESAPEVAVIPADVTRIDPSTTRGFCPPPSRRSRVVILTSGTTGPPKGARSARSNPSLGDAALLDALPIRMNDVSMITSPLFHAWGRAQAAIALSTGSTLVLQAKFDPASTLDAIVRHKVSNLSVVPVILGRLLAAASPSLDLPDLRVVMSSGNVLSATLGHAWMHRFGYHLYNIYGSTETAIATVADPHDLINAPGTVGRAPAGVTISILDENDQPVPTGTLGRVFTANSMQFEGYTDGTDRLRQGTLMATGDLGYLDSVGRLFVDGRENDLIVTGGENVFPSRIEEVLEQHDDVRHAAVVGQPDPEFGQRIVAFVVTRAGFDSADLEPWCREHLAPFELPRTIHQIDQLPMTATGKVIRGALVDFKNETKS